MYIYLQHARVRIPIVNLYQKKKERKMSLFMPENGFIDNYGRSDFVNPDRRARRKKQFVIVKERIIRDTFS